MREPLSRKPRKFNVDEYFAADRGKEPGQVIWSASIRENMAKTYT